MSPRQDSHIMGKSERSHPSASKSLSNLCAMTTRPNLRGNNEENASVLKSTVFLKLGLGICNCGNFQVCKTLEVIPWNTGDLIQAECRTYLVEGSYGGEENEGERERERQGRKLRFDEDRKKESKRKRY